MSGLPESPERTGGAPARGTQAAAYRDFTPGALYALGFLTIVSTFNFFDRSVLSLVLPLIKRDLHLSDTTLGLISGLVFVLFYSALGIPIARLADRTNRRNIIAAGFAFWSLVTMLTGLVANVWQLVVLRFLTGAGEATGVSPSTSMASDLFSRERRPLAMSFISAGSPLASILFLPVAGWIAQQYGWRTTFAAAGIPGLILALAFFLTVKEPVRGASEQRAAPAAADSFWRTVRFLAGARTYVLIIISGCFMGITIYANAVWSATFLVRVHHFTMLQVGSLAGPVRGGLGLVGVLLGGWLTVRLSRIDVRWRVWTPAAACLLFGPAEVLFLLGGSAAASLTGLALASLFNSAYAGPLYAACMNVVKPRMRALASATFLLFAGTMGQIVGPLAVGLLDDHLSGRFGELTIRYSMLVAAVCAVASGLMLWYSGAYMEDDARRAAFD